MESLLAKLERLLTCPACNNILEIPVTVLPCLHVVCRKCLKLVEEEEEQTNTEKNENKDENDSQVKKSKLLCPICNTNCDENQIQSQEIITSILEVLEESKKRSPEIVSLTQEKDDERSCCISDADVTIDVEEVETKKPPIEDTKKVDLDVVEECDGTIVIPSDTKPKRLPFLFYNLCSATEIFNTLKSIGVKLEKDIKSNHEKLVKVHKKYIETYNHHINDEGITEKECNKKAIRAAEDEAIKLIYESHRKSAIRESDVKFKKGIGKHYKVNKIQPNVKKNNHVDTITVDVVSDDDDGNDDETTEDV